MQVRAKVVVNDRHQIVVQLPEDVPPGELEVTVDFKMNLPEHDLSIPLTRDEIRRRFDADGLLLHFDAPAHFVELTDEEQEEIDREIAAQANGRTTLDYINEDREERI